MSSNHLQAEQALSVVLARWGEKAIGERNMLQKRLDDLKRIYPVHFLTDDDILNSETGVFNIQIVDDGDYNEDARVVFMGKTADGKFNWQPASQLPRHPSNVEWESPFHDFYHVNNDGDGEGTGTRIVDEAQMVQWKAQLSPCSKQGCSTFRGCCVCTYGSF